MGDAADDGRVSRKMWPYYRHRWFPWVARDLWAHLRDKGVPTALAISVLIALAAWFGYDADFVPAILVALGGAVAYVLLMFFVYSIRAPVLMHAEVADIRATEQAERERLQAEIRERDTSHFRVRALPPEFLGDTVTQDGLEFGARTFLWLVVENYAGPAARFSARYEGVRGAERSGAAPPTREMRSVSHAIAWEDTADRTTEIGFHGSARLFVAECFRDPKTMWFRLPGSVAWRSKEPHAITPPLQILGDTVEFDVTVTNETESKEEQAHAVVRVDERGGVLAFELSEP